MARRKAWGVTLHAQARPQAVPPPAWRSRPCALSARHPPRREGDGRSGALRNEGDPLAQSRKQGPIFFVSSPNTHTTWLSPWIGAGFARIASAPLFPRFVSKVAAIHYELRKRGTRGATGRRPPRRRGRPSWHARGRTKLPRSASCARATGSTIRT